MYGVELDPVSGRIAKQLYQKNKIAVQGFEETSYPDSFFDCRDRQCSVWSVSGQ